MVEYTGNLKLGFSLGIFIWVFAFIYSTILFEILGIDYQEPGFSFSPGHPKYLQFEFIMTPSFIIVGILLLSFYYRRSDLPDELWMNEGLSIGLLLMFLQFLFDFLIFVVMLDNGLDYFIAFVTISYLFIPVWSLLVAWFWKRRSK